MPAPSPFIIMSLPRSRSFWLAQWLGALPNGPIVGHDLAAFCNKPEDWLDWVSGVGQGTVETGLAEAWPYIRSALPDARMVVLLRPLDEVRQSLQRIGWFNEDVDDGLIRQHKALHELSQQSNVLTVDHFALSDPFVAARLQEFCLPERGFDWAHWLEWCPRRVEIDLEAMAKWRAERRDNLLGLELAWRHRLGAKPPFVWVGFEPLHKWVHEAGGLALAHQQEARGDTEGPLQLDIEVMERLESLNLLCSLVSRINGKLVGYCVWTREINVESAAAPTMLMGAFYVDPARGEYRLGEKMLRKALEFFSNQGIGIVKFHHTLRGRGAKLGVLFQRLGAEPHEYHYKLTLAPPLDERTNPDG